MSRQNKITISIYEEDHRILAARLGLGVSFADVVHALVEEVSEPEAAESPIEG